MDRFTIVCSRTKKSADYDGFTRSLEVTAKINAEQFLSLVNDSDEDVPMSVSEHEVGKFFDRLMPIKPSFLIGEWDVGGFNTEHPCYKTVAGKTLAGIQWVGTNIRTENDADPIMVLDDAGKRVFREDWGHSSLREMVYRGVTSTAMIYDIKPIIHHFRYLDESTVLGAMDCPKVMDTESTFYFYLARHKLSN